MFDIDKFLNGEQGIEVYNQRMFNNFRAWASRHGYTWRNGADPMSEELTEGDNHSLSTASGVRRYAGDRRNIYIMLDGHLSQRMLSYAHSNGSERVYFDNSPVDTLVDEDGFEVETL